MNRMNDCCGADDMMARPEVNMGMTMDFGMNPCCPEMLPGVVCPPVYECPQERCCHREIVHEVPHIVPVNTRIINHHIYKHSYSPCYTCTEENEVTNVYEGNRCGF